MRRFIIGVLIGLSLLGWASMALAAPSVLSTVPANGNTSVDPATTQILVRFDSSMVLSTFGSGRVSINGNAVSTADMQLSDYGGVHNSMLTITCTLVPSMTYNVHIDWRVRDTSWNWMGVNYNFSFTTAASSGDTTPPTVLSTNPISNATGVPLTSSIYISFSEAVDPTSVTTTNITVGGVTGTVSLDTNGRDATFTPSSSLTQNTLYTVTVKGGAGGIRDLYNNNLASNYSWSFRTIVTDTTPPTVTSTNPVNNATSVATSATIKATFSEAVNPSTVNSSNFTVSGVSGTVSYDAGSFTATFTPSSSLANATTFTATISGVRDVNGNTMSAAKVWTFTTAAAIGTTPMANYCQNPPFITTDTATVKPNLLLIVDNSGSMYEFAYKTAGSGNWNGWWGINWDQSYSSTKTYYGYFETSKMYSYNNSGNYFYVDTSKVLDTTSFWSGNLLNWLTMRRVDIIRKVLVGGKTLPRSASTANYLFPTEDPSTDFYKKYNGIQYKIEAGASTEQVTYKYDQTGSTTYNLKIYVGDQDPQQGLIFEFKDRINMGIMNYNNDGSSYEYQNNSSRDGGKLIADIGSNGNDLVTKVEQADPETWTPLAESLYESTRYFRAIESAYNGGTYSGKDPIQYKCQKNFVLILTDGESTMDANVPGTPFSGTDSHWNSGTAGRVTDPNGFNVQTWMNSIAAKEGTSSQKDVYANGMQGTYFLEGVAYWAHVTDLRASGVGKSNLDGMQNLTIYTVFAFDDSAVGRDLLKKAAKYGGFTDYNGTGAPDAVGKWDKNGDGIPDNYFEPKDGSELEDSLRNAFNDILAKVSSGTAASILSNSEGSGAILLQAVFFPKKYFDAGSQVDWIGEMQSFWYYIDPFFTNTTIREDTNSDFKLGLTQDRVINFVYDANAKQTSVHTFWDTNGDGAAEVTDIVLASLDDVKSLWKAGLTLWSRTANRTIYTGDPGSATASRVDFNTDNTTSGIHKQNSWWPWLQAADENEAKKIIDYVNGKDQSGYRSRMVTINSVSHEWKLGDIVDSTPKIEGNVRLNSYSLPAPQGYNDTSYRQFITSNDYQARGMAYVGANDGMMHAFNLGRLDTSTQTGAPNFNRATLNGSNLGREEWAFIPKNSLPYLKYLGDPLYNHIFFVDGTTVVLDVSINPVASTPAVTGCTASTYWNCEKQTNFVTATNNLDFTNTSWRTILIGSMGVGGASRNKTDGCSASTECVKTPVDGLGYSSYFALDVTDPYNPIPLWEFVGDPANGHYLGYSTTGPAIVRVGNGKANGRWFAVFGSGPTGPIDTTNQQFKGTSFQNLKLFIVDLATGTLVNTIDTGLTQAFAGTLSTSVIDTERGSPYDLGQGNYQDDAVYIGYTQYNSSSGAWDKGGVIRLVTQQSLTPDSTDADKKWISNIVIDGIGPVTNSVTKLQERAKGNLWLYFGTGRYFFKSDDYQSSRRLYGILDPCYNKTTNKLNTSCSDKRTVAQLKNQTTNPGTSLDLTSYKGWYINLDSYTLNDGYGSERNVSNPVASSSGLVYFATFRPTTDVCEPNGNSYLWRVPYNTGGEIIDPTSKGSVLMQLSTGAYAQIDTFGASYNRKSSAYKGKGGGEFPLLNPPPASKKILHIQEK